MNHQILADAKLLWDYHCLEGSEREETVSRADIVLGLGSYDGGVAEHAADLLLAGKARWILFSGGATRRDDLLKSPWSRPEAVEFRDIAIRRGAPEASILMEPLSTNTGENFRFSIARLAALGITYENLIVVAKPYMKRRARATGRRYLNGVPFTMSSQAIDFEDYLTRFDPVKVINLMVGDFQRIQLYPALGFQAAEDIPPEIEAAVARLIAARFDKHLIRPPS
jgi:uncharacterized SAM-binding protein YcdF (DUF218 family)